MMNATFSRQVRPIPMLLTGAFVFLASCGSTPDEPAPAPEELASVEAPLTPNAEAEGASAPDADPEVAAEPVEDEVDLQVAGMRAALQDALRESGIDPDTLEVEGAVEPEPVAALVAEEPPADVVAEADAAEAEAAEALAETDASTAPAPSGDAAEPAELANAELADQPAADALVAAEPAEPVAVVEEPALTPAERAKIEAELMLLSMDPGRVAPAEFDDFYTPPAPEPEEVAAQEPVAADAELALEVEAAPLAEDGIELVVLDATEQDADEAEPSTLALEDDAVIVMETAELEALANAAEQAPQSEGEALADADAAPEPSDQAEGATLADMDAPDVLIPEADAALASELEQPAEADATMATALDAEGADMLEPALATATEPATEPQAEPAAELVAELPAEPAAEQVAAEPAAEGDAFAKYGAIQWEVVEHTALLEPTLPDTPSLNGSTSAEGALDIQTVPVPQVATALGSEWGALGFMQQLPVEERLLLAPLCALDPTGGVARLSLAMGQLSSASQAYVDGPPQDPSVDGLNYSNGAEFEPVPVDPKAVVINEPGIGMIWWSSDLPTEQVSAAAEIQTPSVGRIRLVLNSGDYVEGTLHSVGQNQYWLDGDLGRFAVRAGLVAHIERLPKPGLGQQIKGLQAGDLVRAKAKTGFIEGRLISMKDGKALVETATGMRITIEDAEVEPMGQSKTRVVVD